VRPPCCANAPPLGQVLCQSEADAARLRCLGAARAQCLGSLKAAAAPIPTDPRQLTRIRAALCGGDEAGDGGEGGAGVGAGAGAGAGAGQPRAVWVAASTHAGEEEIAAAAHARVLAGAAARGGGGTAPLLVLVPRHAERGAAVARALRRSFPGWHVALLSDAGLARGARATALVADAYGCLAEWYEAAGLALVGASLVPGLGGHNVAEPAALGCATLVGPHTEAASAVVAALQAHDPAACRRVAGEREARAPPAKRFLLIEMNCAPRPALRRAERRCAARAAGGGGGRAAGASGGIRSRRRARRRARRGRGRRARLARANRKRGAPRAAGPLTAGARAGGVAGHGPAARARE